jgi:tubby-related protein 1
MKIETKSNIHENRNEISKHAIEAVDFHLISPLETINWNDIESKRQFLMKPCPKNVMTEFYVRRHKGFMNLFTPEYRVYLRSGHIFLMSSKKRPKKPTSNYLISMNYDQLKGSASILGKLRSNFLGSEYQIYDSGRNPKHTDPFFEENRDVQTRSELGAVLYGTHWLGTGEPRKMSVCINRVMDEQNVTCKKWQPAHEDEEMIRCFKYRSASAMRNLQTFVNKVHENDEDHEEILRSFQGRVTLSSVKNFQLVGEDDGKIVMQFGRVDSDEFVMDVQWPISPFQAFAIALSACDTKIACGD